MIMSSTRTIALAAALAALALTTAPAIATEQDARGCATDAPAPVVRELDRWTAALASGDADRVAGLYAEDATLIAGEGRAAIVGRATIRDYYAQLLTRHPEGVIRSRDAAVAAKGGCDTAADSGTYHLRVTGRRMGTRMLLGGRFAVSYERREGAWQIARHVLSQMPRALTPVSAKGR